MSQAKPLPDATKTKDEHLEELHQEYERVQGQLRELDTLIEHSQLEVDKLAQRNQTITTRLRQIEDNFDTVPRSDIKTTFEAALDARQRLLTMRGQLEKLQSDRNNLQRFSDVLRRVLTLVEGAEIVEDTPAKSEALGASTVVRIVEAQEAERLRLARQMHDGPAQSLTNFILQAEICQRLFDRDPRRASEELNNLKAAASGTFQKVRDFIADLRPMMLDDLGLVPTVRRYVDSFQDKTNITVQLNVTGEERRLESYREVVMFRGIQELLNNVRDHAGASRINVTLDMDVDYVKVVVDDNGRGFNADELSHRSTEDSRPTSLSTLRERIELIGGELTIDSIADEGTVVTIRMPTGAGVY